MSKFVFLAERGWLPDWVIRRGIRRLLRQRLTYVLPRLTEQRDVLEKFADALRYGPLKAETVPVMRQTTELPVAFYQAMLGKRLKYSCGFWPEGKATLDDAEDLMLALTCDRAPIADGLDILEVGCGWGSLCLWMAESFPNSRVVGMTNSQVQRKFIERQASARRLSNLKIVVSTLREFTAEKKFDRVVAIETFEDFRNYEYLLGRVHEWLRPAGKLFVQQFCHKELAYFFDMANGGNWMERNFFPGGMMPADQLLPKFQRDLMLERQWHVDGTHYAQTAEAWLKKLDANRAAVREVFETLGSKRDAAVQMRRWRMFLLAVAETFGYRNGQEWWVSQYRFVKR
jgi:cyclopropane-fatty-acyl-phospholipid synthase